MVKSQQLDPTDRRILLALDEDPRAPIMVLAQKLGLARGTVQSRVERMTASGVFRANSTRVQPEGLGRGVLAEVSAELDQSHLNEAVAALGGIPEVLECLAPAGDTDLLIRVVATSPDDLYRVSEEIRLCPGIRRTSTRMILRTVIPYRTSPLLAEPEGGGPQAPRATPPAPGRAVGSPGATARGPRTRGRGALG
ncbi:Lrp/AsnC family transcriptional regulator [Sinomonas sp. P10A9]|uniref:Lrp/AsnC family transcriptional regulator n=1 Tax=Sinomonas puerhi TaxID=3238584 RepID=A0AB39L4G9_9MICC